MISPIQIASDGYLSPSEGRLTAIAAAGYLLSILVPFVFPFRTPYVLAVENGHRDLSVLNGHGDLDIVSLTQNLRSASSDRNLSITSSDSILEE